MHRDKIIPMIGNQPSGTNVNIPHCSNQEGENLRNKANALETKDKSFSGHQHWKLINIHQFNLENAIEL